MNIIKFKDTVVEGQDWYNNNLRGKYAYWVRCHVVVPIESITTSTYIDFEVDINNLYKYDFYTLIKDSYDVYTYEFTYPYDLSPKQKQTAEIVTEVPADPTETSPSVIKIDRSTIKYIDLSEDEYSWMKSYIDDTETTNINSVDSLIQYNNYVPGTSTPKDELRRFRTWLATTLLDLNYTFYSWNSETSVYEKISSPTLTIRLSAIEETEVPTEKISDYIKIKDLSVVDWSDQAKHILYYYSNGMYDDTLKWVNEFGGINTDIGVSIIQNNCGCVGSSNLSSLYQDNVNICNVPGIYKTSIKNGMIKIFSNPETWTELPTSYLSVVKSYIDGVIQSNFAFYANDSSKYYGCECINTSGQENALSILRQLSVAFGYMIDGESTYKQHLNFIMSVLTRWASELYELMEWA